MENQEIRIDKFLWATRVYKTRSLASEECKKGRVSIGEESVKPSRVVRAGDVITVKKLPVIYTFRVIDPIGNRIGASLVPLYLNDLTPESEKAKLNVKLNPAFGLRERGTGRPTKRERRIIDRFKDSGD